MPQSYSQILLHVVFSTKNRAPFINEDAENELHAYIGGCLKNHGSFPYIIGGITDHVHIACTLPRTTSVSDMIEQVKRSSSHKAKEIVSARKLFSWQTGYGAFSLGQSQLPNVVRYINNQKQHHRHQTFKEEFIEFLNKYDVEYDPKYIWE